MVRHQSDVVLRDIRKSVTHPTRPTRTSEPTAIGWPLDILWIAVPPVPPGNKKNLVWKIRKNFMRFDQLQKTSNCKLCENI
jgi:hypothetical protein